MTKRTEPTYIDFNKSPISEALNRVAIRILTFEKNRNDEPLMVREAGKIPDIRENLKELMDRNNATIIPAEETRENEKEEKGATHYQNYDSAHSGLSDVIEEHESNNKQ